MANSSARTCEGVFAIHKPPDISSAQVIRDVQSHFNSAALFQPWFEQENARRDSESANQRNKRKSWKQRQPLQLKIGHGGTLDPMATGVLILGVGSGTKQLSKFLECTKSYEAVVLFGAATDTYDAVGKVVARRWYQHVTKEMVESALKGFRGKIMQRPPIFSALRVKGKRLYEYAREGKEVPVEIQERPVEVENLEMVEWMEGGSHSWQWPTERAATPERAIAEKVLHFESDRTLDGESPSTSDCAKRKRGDGEGEAVQSPPDATTEPPAKREKWILSPERERSDEAATAEQQIFSTRGLPNTEPEGSAPCPAPACRLRMTVTSGFYVRSLCHDLGAAVGSVALMSSLVRTRQGNFELGDNVLEYSDLAKGEPIWESKVESMLREWHSNQPATANENKGVARKDGRRNSSSRSSEHWRKKDKPGQASMRRRNSSSDDD